MVRILHERKRQYYLLLDPFEGLGSTPKQNSQELIAQAPTILICLSDAYVSRYSDFPNGNIGAEIEAYHKRVAASAEPPTAIVAIDDWKSIAERFQWSLVGLDAAPYFGPSVSECDAAQLSTLVDEIIKVLDGDRTLGAS